MRRLYWRAGMKPKRIKKGFFMIGKNVFILNEETMCQAVNSYFAREFCDSNFVRVQSVRTIGAGRFEVVVEGKTPSTKPANNLKAKKA
jgi:hypothetical protein